MEVASVRKKAINTAFLLVFFTMFSLAASAEVPDWLRSLAKQPTKTYDEDVNGVILVDDVTTTVKENGEIIHHGRLVFKILRPEGRDLAYFPVAYDSDSKINYFHGWSITSKGQEYEIKDKDAMEQTVSSYEVYSDTKVKVLRAPGAEVGTVVGFEWEKKERPYIFQDVWYFQSFLPVEESRYELHLAPGWRFKSDWVNHTEQKPTEDAGAVVWQMNSSPRIEREPHRPPSEALAGRMIMTFLSDKMPNKSYRNWSEFGSWYTDLASGVRNPSPALQQKVRELAPADKPIIERIKALASFAQHDVRYVEIKIGIGGYRPHTASDIFNHRYGDCKDKATVLSSMLSEIGVKSYYVLVRTDRGVFTQNSPPQAQFDHMILAISLPEASYSKPLPAMINHPKLGRLLIFDPTNDMVPFGQIPFYEQDNYGLAVGDQGGEYIHLPLTSPEANGIVRNAKLKLSPDGSLSGEVEETLSGFQAMSQRMYLQRESGTDKKKLIEHFLGSSINDFQIESFDIVNNEDIEKDLVLRYKFSAEHYARNAGPLLLLRPRIVGEFAGSWDTSKPRQYAYEFPAPFLNSDQVEITLPEGFKVDEVPDPIKAAFPFAEYTSKTEAAGNVLKYTRAYKVETTLVPVDNLEKLKKLFTDITADERNQAVLKKVN